MCHVFVYGTLLSGEPNNHLLKNSQVMGTEVVSGFILVNLGAFPALIPVNDESQFPVLGEVWRIDDEVLQRLDWLEGYPHFYDRKLVPTFAGDAWVYFIHEEKMEHDGAEVITCGSWKKFLGK